MKRASERRNQYVMLNLTRTERALVRVEARVLRKPEAVFAREVVIEAARWLLQRRSGATPGDPEQGSAQAHRDALLRRAATETLEASCP